MFRYLYCVLYIFLMPALASGVFYTPEDSIHKPITSVTFTENKGQISDYNNNPRRDVLFSGSAKEMSFYLREDGVSYQMYKVDSWKKVQALDNLIPKNNTLKGKEKRIPDQITIYRLDVNWLNCNAKTILSKENAKEGYVNYYLAACPNGALKVKTYEKVTYQNIYQGINLIWYQKDGDLKYDYIIKAGNNYKQIRLEVNGAEKISINGQGELILKTPIGDIIEQPPMVIQQEKELKAKWVVNNNIVGFEIENLNPNEDFVIDPGVRTWGTYYGGTGTEYGVCCCTDKANNVLFAGSASNYSTTIIATVGAFQVTSPSWSEFLAKFNSNGQRQWATYYAGGATPFDEISCAVDQNGNAFLAGATPYTTNISTANSQQSAYAGGGSDAFLVKFDLAGTRLWGTYYGGTQDDRGYSCITDNSGNVYLAGFTNSTNNIATSGCQQSTFAGGTYDAFLVKFNSSGQRQWGTYYGGSNDEYGYSCATDPAGNIYLSGVSDTDAGTIIATPGSHQSTLGSIGYTDAFLVKFNSAGQRQWGTYYGGSGIESNSSCAIDTSGNIYLFGTTQTNSGTSIATPGSHQPSYGGGVFDSFLAKLDSNGVRQWGTYYGGSNWDVGWYCATDKKGNVYISGSTDTNTGTVIATPGTQQSTFNSNVDAYLVCFGPGGQRHWGTYYGGPGGDEGYSCTVDNIGNVYICGSSNLDSGNLLGTAGSQQPTFGGNVDAIFAQFDNCIASAPLNITPNNNVHVCANSSVILFASGTGTISWFATAGSSSVLATGTVFTIPALNAGTYTFYAGSSLPCGSSYERTAITITVSNILPVIQATSNQTVTCAGQQVSLSASGALTYTWMPGGVSSNISVFPGVTTDYLVAGTSSNGCVNSASILVQVNPLPILNINTSSNSQCSGQSTTLNVTGALSYTWFPQLYLSSSITVVPASDINYTVVGIDNKGCRDTIILNIPVTPTPTLNVTPFFYLCNGSASLSASGAETFSWSPGNLTGSFVLVSPVVTTSYTVLGANKNCTSTAVSIVSIGIAPPFFIESSAKSGCKGSCFTFSNNSNLFNPYTYLWGDTSSIIPLLTNHCYTYSGNYQVTAQAIYTSGCHVTSADIINITILPLPEPFISVNNGRPLNVNRSIVFQNLSTGAQKFEWLFGDQLSESALSTMDVNHVYLAAGNYCIKLIAIDTVSTCKDSLTKCFDVLCPSEINIPNVFTPNDDGVNDIFAFKASCIKSLNCTIYNRWGTEMRSWNGIDGWWNGKTDSGLPASDGTYFFILEYVDENNTVVKKSGSVFLVR